MPDDDFYREQLFQEIRQNFAEVKKKQDDQAKDISDIKAKLSYMVGWAVGAGAVASILYEYVKAKFFNS